jgi:hypothetical protein
MYDKSKWVFPVPELTAERPEDVYEFIFSSVDLSKPVAYYGQANEFSPFYRDILEADYRKRLQVNYQSYRQYTVTINIRPESKFYTHDYVFMNQSVFAGWSKMVNNADWVLINSRDFQSLGITADIYALP